jgi:predicted DNA binding CopG/RHH family protein
MTARRKPAPRFATEAEERAYWEKTDSTRHIDWSKAERVEMPNLKPTTESISLRLPSALLARIKAAANRRDMPYQSLIKAWLAERIDAPSPPAKRRATLPSSARRSG